MSLSGRASQNQGRRTDVREVNQGNAFMQVKAKFTLYLNIKPCR